MKIKLYPLFLLVASSPLISTKVFKIIIAKKIMSRLSNAHYSIILLLSSIINFIKYGVKELSLFIYKKSINKVFNFYNITITMSLN